MGRGLPKEGASLMIVCSKRVHPQRYMLKEGAYLNRYAVQRGRMGGVGMRKQYPASEWWRSGWGWVGLGFAWVGWSGAGWGWGWVRRGGVG